MPQKPAAHELRFAVLATDVVLLTYKDGDLYVRLIPVDLPPFFQKLHGLPGGLLRPDEVAEQAAKRHVEVKAKIVSGPSHLEQLYTFSEIDRDPRGRVVSVAYLALVPWERLTETERGLQTETGWYPAKRLPKLAYDHAEIIRVALERFRTKIVYSTLISKLMPKEFTLTELEQAYARILEKGMDKRNFRKKILKLKIVKELDKKRSGLKQRPASLFKFVSEKVREASMV